MRGKSKFSWADDKTWPPDGKGYVFLGRALRKVGAHLFPEAWTDRDPHVLPLPLPDTAADAKAGHLLAAQRLLGEYFPETPPPTVDFTGLENSREQFSKELWGKALDASRRQVVAASEAKERFRAAKEEIRRLCVTEVIVSAQRWNYDGSHSALKATLWNLPKFETWFEHCQISSADAYGKSSGYDEYQWLFIGEAGLNALVDPLATSPSAAEQSKGYRSKYLRFLLAAADALDVKPDDARPHKQVSNDVRTFARTAGVKEISPAMADKMATILREPEAGKGKDGPRFKKN
ncbi:hypothetical protein NKH75_01540 [Mesorhizobium sp. M0984]|uniref:hypothetical protein n=1 Tax=Mesorhizobium sp. M0984 TaxID=2957041 RepID=UPI00333C9348